MKRPTLIVVEDARTTAQYSKITSPAGSSSARGALSALTASITIEADAVLRFLFDPLTPLFFRTDRSMPLSHAPSSAFLTLPDCRLAVSEAHQ